MHIVAGTVMATCGFRLTVIVTGDVVKVPQTLVNERVTL